MVGNGFDADTCDQKWKACQPTKRKAVEKHLSPPLCIFSINESCISICQDKPTSSLMFTTLNQTLKLFDLVVLEI